MRKNTKAIKNINKEIIKKKVIIGKEINKKKNQDLDRILIFLFNLLTNDFKSFLK